jgi:hypothetical protein
LFLATDPPARHRGQQVGNGHCVPFVQHVSDAPLTMHWRRGRKVRGGDVEPGTVIATFGENGIYTNRTDGTAHAAILIAEQANGLLVWDQWIGQPVHQRTLRFRGGAGQPINDGDAFFVVETEANVLLTASEA